MRKFLSLVVLAVAVTACTVPTTTDVAGRPAPTSPPTTSRPASGLTRSDLEDLYIKNIRNEHSWVIDTLGRSGTIELGRLICEMIDAGAGFDYFVGMALDADLDPGVLGWIIGSAVPAFCPWNEGWER